MAERELRVKILGDSSSAERAFKRTADASEKIKPSAKLAQDALDQVSGSITGKLGPASGVADDALKKITTGATASGSALSLGLAGGAIVAGGALTAFAVDGVSSLLDLSNQVRDFQRASGASAEESSAMVAVLDDLGISAETGSSAIFKLGREVAAGGSKLREYGIEIAKNADGTANFAETLLNVADAYSRAPDQATKTAIAFAAFGKQAQGLIPLLEKGRIGLAEFFEGAQHHGQILSQEDLDRARELELALDDLQDAMRGLQLIGAKALTPFLTTVADAGAKITEKIGQIDSATGGLLTKLGAEVAKQPLGPLGKVLDLLPGKADKAKDSTESLGDATGDLAETTDDMVESERRAIDAHRDAERAAAGYSSALRDMLRASEEMIGSQLSVADAVDRLRDSQADSAEKEKALAAAIKDHGRTSAEAAIAGEELEDARRRELRDIDALAKARRDLAVQQAEEAGQTLTDADKYRIYRDELIKLKDAMAPGSPLRVHLEQLINALPPPEVKFAIFADTKQADAALERLRLQYLAFNQANPGAVGPTLFGPVGTGAPAPATTTSSTRVRIQHVGGPIDGPTDEVPIIAQRGEFMMRRSAVDKIGRPTLERLNRMHTGGPVGALTPADAAGITSAATGPATATIDYERLAAAIAGAIPDRPSAVMENHFSGMAPEAALQAATAEMGWRMALLSRARR